MVALYPFQKRVSDLLLSGKSVILQAPTGAGKTRAALYPFLRAWEYEEDFPRKCLYTVPMRVLANQFWAEYQARVENYGFKRPMKVNILTGEHRADTTFSGDLTFATIDQVLSSFLIAPYSLPRRLSNLNAGAITSSYLIFDEFHLFDPVSTLPTTLSMLKMLDGIVPFLLMTATFSGQMLDGLARELNAVVIPEDAATREELLQLPSQDKTRRYHVVDSHLTATAVLAGHKSRTLVVCNVVDRARKLFEDLRNHPDLEDTQVLLLHSRFLPEDRSRIEAQIHELFSRNGDTGGRRIVVATQVIEVGLDITSETLYTELAPANAILQRAGRCARYAGQAGDVYIYTQALHKSGELISLVEKIAPYMEQKETISRTLEAFLDYNGQALTFDDEQAIISRAHGPSDSLNIKGLTATSLAHRSKMNHIMNGDRNYAPGNLIREVSSQLVAVHDDAQRVAQQPFATEAFSLHPGTLYGQLHTWEKDGQLEGGKVLALQDSGDTNENGRSVYDWREVTSPKDIQGAALVLIHPDLAGYDAELGFLMDRSTGYRAKLQLEQATHSPGRIHYKLETYVEHIRLVHNHFKSHIWPQLDRTAAQLECIFGWPQGIVEQAAHMVVLFHDVGKLGRDWQGWVQNYQDAIELPVQPGEVYAHTDFDPTIPRHEVEQRSLGHRPPHALEGAWAVQCLLNTVCGECEAMFNAAFTAIARHHGAFTQQGQHYALVSQAVDVVQETLSWLPESMLPGIDAGMLVIEGSPTERNVRDFLVDAQEDEDFLAYTLLVRALRLSDQEGTKKGAE
ncbi:MAG: CRISPR-associated helicase Cas3' [Anaerolineae bacterium]|nr:CRISPR-associated helicase Cas3' [Anaerolineae bacterium]